MATPFSFEDAMAMAQKDIANADVTGEEPQNMVTVQSKPKTLKEKEEEKRYEFLRKNLAAETARREDFYGKNVGQHPLDIETGIDAGDVALLSFRRTDSDKKAYLESKYGKGNVRLATNGGLIVKTQDESGMPIERLAVPLYGEKKSQFAPQAASFVGPTVKALPGIATAIAMPSSAPWALSAAGVAGADVATNISSDMVTRAADNQPLNVGESALNAAPIAAMDMGLPAVGRAVLGAGRQAVKVARGPFAGSMGDIQTNAAQAINNLKTKYGVEVPLSAGQATGNSLLMRAEAFNETIIPNGPLAAQRKEQLEALRALQGKIVGGPVMHESDIGKEVAGILGKKASAMTTEAAAFRQEAAEFASDRIAADMGIHALAVDPTLKMSDVGSVLRASLSARKDSVAAPIKEAYTAIDSQIGPVKLENLKSELAKIKKDYPEIVRDVAPYIDQYIGMGSKIPKGPSQTGILDQFGQPVWAPPQQDLTISQLRDLRTVIRDKISFDAPIGGQRDRVASRVAEALTKDENAAAQAAGVLPELDKARKAWGKFHDTFEASDIAKLFKDPMQGVKDEDVVRGIFAGEGSPSLLNHWKGILGADSSEYALLKRGALNEIVDTSRIAGDTRISADRLLNRIEGMHPEIRKEVFGAGEKSIKDNLKVLRELQGQKINPQALLDAFQNPTAAGDTLLRAAQIEAQRDAAYKTSIFQRLFQGDVEDLNKINPADFVSRGMSTMTPSEVSQVTSHLGADAPKQLEAIRRRAIQNVLIDSSEGGTPIDIAARQSGNSAMNVKASKLDRILGNPTEKEKLTNLLGKDTVDSLEDYLSIEALRETKEGLGRSSGSLVQAGMLSEAMKGNEVSYLDKWVRFRIASSILSTPGLRTWAAQARNIGEVPNWATQAIVKATPIMRGLYDEFADNPELRDAVISAFTKDAQQSKIANDPFERAKRDMLQYQQEQQALSARSQGPVLMQQ